MRKLFFAAFAALTLVACDESRVFEKNIDFGDRFWPVSEKPEFEFNIPNDEAGYNLYCNIRNSLNYPYARFYYRWTLMDSTGAALNGKMEEALLFDQKTGEPIGDSGLGDIFDQRISFLENYDFPYTGKYKVRLEQYMRADSLQGVLAVGLRVEKASAK